VLLHGPAGSGKTALAATMALGSNYPFIKLISPESMVGYNEAGKINELNKIFSDSYKSPISVIVIDSIERILGKSLNRDQLRTMLNLITTVPSARLEPHRTSILKRGFTSAGRSSRQATSQG
jgi:SpoVK/Ycf46/Vps4 family AAA+-type ATPase